MDMAGKMTIKTYSGLEEFIQGTQSPVWKKYHNNRTCYEAYVQLKKNLEPIQDITVEGAMKDGIDEALKIYQEKMEKIVPGEDKASFKQKIHDLFASDPVIFLNDHGPHHIEKVIERANSIVMNFKGEPLSEFEVFLLLCAIQIHDIGNVLGRAGHERKLVEIFNEKGKNIILDAPERRVITSIAMAHGGKSSLGGKDTISMLSPSESIFDAPVRTRLLAAVLRFSDELADDSTRANRDAMDLGILGTNSDIYHCYSRALHTVSVREDFENQDCKISLVYELEADLLRRTYKVGGYEKYLLDEIYDRTLKMELERRYCMKFMYSSINIGRIDVTINIYGRTSEKIQGISYTLEDVSYPELPIAGQIRSMWKNSEARLPSGEELLQSLLERGVIYAES